MKGLKRRNRVPKKPKAGPNAAHQPLEILRNCRQGELNLPLIGPPILRMPKPMPSFGFAHYAFRLPLPLSQFAVEVRSHVALLDPSNFLLMGAALHKARTRARFLREAGQAYGTLPTRAPKQTIALAQAMIEFLIGGQTVILWTPLAIAFALVDKVAATPLPCAQVVKG